MKFYDKFKKCDFEPLGSLRLIQVFIGGQQTAPPICDGANCRGLSKVLLSDEDNRAFCLCLNCVFSSPVTVGTVRIGTCDWCKDIIGEPHTDVFDPKTNQSQPKKCTPCDLVRQRIELLTGVSA
jgi:hypothetical protein